MPPRETVPDIVLFDLEFTAWEGSLERNWTGHEEHREVVQIGAVRLAGSSLAERAHFEALVRPRINPELSPYFTELTGITEERLRREGVAFPDAYARFLAFAARAIPFAYGRDDAILRENLDLHPSRRLRQIVAADIRPWLARQGLPVGSLSSSELPRATGHAETFRAHDALEDARAIAAALRQLLASGAPHPFAAG